MKPPGLRQSRIPLPPTRRFIREVEQQRKTASENSPAGAVQNSATTPTAAPAPVNDQQCAATEAATAEAATGDVQVGNGIYKNVARTMKEAVEVLKTLSAVDIVTRATGRSAQINSEQRNKLVSDRARRKSNANGFPDADHFMAVVNIKELFENSQLLDSVQDRNNDQNIKSIKHFSAPMTINGKKADVYMTIKESVSNGHRIYSLELTEIRKPSDVQDGKLKSNELYHTSDGSEVNIAPSSEKSSRDTSSAGKTWFRCGNNRRRLHLSGTGH